MNGSWWMPWWLLTMLAYAGWWMVTAGWWMLGVVSDLDAHDGWSMFLMPRCLSISIAVQLLTRHMPKVQQPTFDHLNCKWSCCRIMSVSPLYVGLRFQLAESYGFGMDITDWTPSTRLSNNRGIKCGRRFGFHSTNPDHVGYSRPLESQHFVWTIPTIKTANGLQLAITRNAQETPNDVNIN